MAPILGFHGEIWGEEFLTPLNVWEGLIHSQTFSQLCLYHYAEISQKHNLGVQSIYNQTSNDIQSTPSKLVHLAKKTNHFSLGRMD